MKITRSIVLAAALVFAWATVGFAAHPTDSWAKRIESFNYVVDYSGSMMLKHKKVGEEKINLAKKVLTKINAEVPAFDYQGGLFTMAPYGAVVKQGPWNRDAIAKGVNSFKSNIDPFARMTPLGSSLSQHDTVIKGMTPKAAVILVSDGESNRGIDPVAEARAIYAANPDVCFHVISVADTPEGQATLDAIAALNSCTVAVNAIDLLESDAAVTKFVEDVFITPAFEEEVVVLRGVNFAFNSDQLDSTAQGILNEAARLIKSRPGVHIRLLGYTDSVGSDAYNMGLSQRRANSVRNYLSAKGVSPSIMQAEGKGKSFRYDNATEEGRYMNRRCELVFAKDK